jgi:hypothetical protein
MQSSLPVTHTTYQKPGSRLPSVTLSHNPNARADNRIAVLDGCNGLFHETEQAGKDRAATLLADGYTLTN